MKLNLEINKYISGTRERDRENTIIIEAEIVGKKSLMQIIVIRDTHLRSSREKRIFSFDSKQYRDAKYLVLW